MEIHFEVPPYIEEVLRKDGRDPHVEAKEACLAQLHRVHRISHRQVGEALGLDQYETDGMLKRHEVWLDISVEELKQGVLSLRDVKPD